MRRAWFLVLVLISPLLLNDIVFILLSKRLAAWAQWVVDLCVYPLPLSALLLLYAGQGWLSFRKFNLRGGKLHKDLLWAVWPAAVLLFICHYGIRGFLCGILLPETWSYGWSFPEDQPLRLLVIVYAAVTAGFFEEIIFRGWVTAKLSEFYSPRLGRLLSGLLFAAIHWGQGLSGLLTALAFALLIQDFYDNYGNMRSTIMAHVLYDLWVFW